MPDPVAVVARELNLAEHQVRATADLLEGGATIPFVARYRKEATGSLDEVAIAAVRDGLARRTELEKRRAAIRASLEERELLTPELAGRLDAAETLAELEDLYLPFRPKRKTRASAARAKGLEPLAQALLAQDGRRIDVDRFVDAERGVSDREAALAGARDIVAEQASEDAEARAELRALFDREARLSARVVKAKRDAAAKFRDYFDWEEPLRRAPSHRVLAVLRGGNEGFLTVHARPPEGPALVRLERRFLRRGGGFATGQVREALHDAYKRLLAPALERETLRRAKETADAEAIRVFARNLRELLMAAPLGGKRVVAVDPGFRTGCKAVALDARGALLGNTVVYLHRAEEARRSLRAFCERHDAEAIAIGNGTAGRETEALVRDLGLAAPVVVVDESGASVYSASDVAREEFPDQDVTVRGAVSIGRRLQDPLAELVKIDPQAIGVGQYQHDVDQALLRASLDDTVQSCVNAVGVDANTASPQLLTYVAGLGPQLARNLVSWRNEHGAFRSRRELLKVPRLGAKAFEQAAGFLRIRGGRHPLDASAVHPERYALVERMAKDLGCRVADLLDDPARRDALELSRYAGAEVGLPTLEDIRAELAKPGRDPRPAFEAFEFADVHELTDLEPGMRLPGVVTNVTNFGAFVDVGVHCDGLVHISQLADGYVKDPHDIVKVRQRVTVRVLDVDLERRRISLSLKA